MDTFSSVTSIKRLFETPDSDLPKSEACAGGWIKSVRVQGKSTDPLVFIHLSDGSTSKALQVIFRTTDTEETPGAAVRIARGCSSVLEDCPREDLHKKFTRGASLQVVGTLVASPARGQRVELQVEEIRFFGPCDGETAYPIPKSCGRLGAVAQLEFLRTLPHLRPRVDYIAAIHRISHALSAATHRFFDDHGFTFFRSPIITSSDCEGAGEMFGVTTALGTATATERTERGEHRTVPVYQLQKKKCADDFFSRPAFLTVSGQLEGETYACALSRIYTFGPTFRAENSHTSRHLAEFWMIEPEIAFCELPQLMDCASAFVKHCVSSVLERCPEELDMLQRRSELERYLESDVVRLSYTDAIRILSDEIEKSKGKKSKAPMFEDMNIHWGMDLGSEHEKFLVKHCGDVPTIIYDYPADIKSFYMKRNIDTASPSQSQRDTVSPSRGACLGDTVDLSAAESQRDTAASRRVSPEGDTVSPSRGACLGDTVKGPTVAAMDMLVPDVGELIGGSEREHNLLVLEKVMRRKGLDPEKYKEYLDLRRFGTVPHSGFGVGFERLVQWISGVGIREVIPYPRYPGHL